MFTRLLIHSIIEYIMYPRVHSSLNYSSTHRSTNWIPPSLTRQYIDPLTQFHFHLFVHLSIHPLMPPLTIHPVFPSATSVFPRSVKAAPAPPAEAAVCASASANWLGGPSAATAWEDPASLGTRPCSRLRESCPWIAFPLGTSSSQVCGGVRVGGDGVFFYRGKLILTSESLPCCLHALFSFHS